MLKKIIINVLNIIILLLSVSIIYFVKTYNLSFVIKLIMFIVIMLTFALQYIFKWFKYVKLYKFFYVLFLIISIAINAFILLNHFGIIETLSSVVKLKEYILSTKEKGVILYILIQCAQVIFLPIPAAIICVVGTIIYGPFLSGIYCSLGVLIGSYISFIIGRTFGYRIVSWIVGKTNTDKYLDIIRKKGGFFLIIAFLLPMFPDDILCLIAGITKMKFKAFFWIALLTRPIGVLCMSYFSSGSIIPFTGWGIYAWICLLIIGIFASIIIYKYQDKMQNYILRKLFKKNKN